MIEKKEKQKRKQVSRRIQVAADNEKRAVKILVLRVVKFNNSLSKWHPGEGRGLQLERYNLNCVTNVKKGGGLTK